MSYIKSSLISPGNRIASSRKFRAVASIGQLHASHLASFPLSISNLLIFLFAQIKNSLKSEK